MVAYRVSAEQLSAADALVAREQMQLQFRSLSNAQQQAVIDAARHMDSPEGVRRAILVLNDAVVGAARQALADVQAARAQQSAKTQSITPKLGGDADLVFVATAGPCRVADSRFWLGPLGPGSALQVWAFSSIGGFAWSAQGGTGTAGAGNCAGTVYPGTRPVSVVATVSVVNTTTAGALQAWNGGTTLSGGAVVNWLAGERLSNTTVIPMDRTITPFPGSGSKRDIAVNNNSGGNTDFVIDVVGYFMENHATPLDCTVVVDPGFNIAPGASILASAPACPAGYTNVMAQSISGGVFGVYTGTLTESQCRLNNTTGATQFVGCNAYCCRVPGQ